MNTESAEAQRAQRHCAMMVAVPVWTANHDARTQEHETLTVIPDADDMNIARPGLREMVLPSNRMFLLTTLSGWDFWTNEITSCGADSQCLDVKRINVSAAYFLSIEFQQTGYPVERMYKAAYGDASGNSTLGEVHQRRAPILSAVLTGS